jgi:hypothetical protein
MRCGAVSRKIRRQQLALWNATPGGDQARTIVYAGAVSAGPSTTTEIDVIGVLVVDVLTSTGAVRFLVLII